MYLNDVIIHSSYGGRSRLDPSPRLIVARIKAATIFCVIRKIYARPTTLLHSASLLRLLSLHVLLFGSVFADREAEREREKEGRRERERERDPSPIFVCRRGSLTSERDEERRH